MVPDKKDCYYLGYISKTKGFKGDLIIFMDVDDPSYYKSLEFMLIEQNGTLTPFFIKSIHLKQKNFAEVRLNGVESRDQAAEISGCDIYLPLTLLPKLDDDQYYLHDLEGMEVHDIQAGNVGSVQKVLDYGVNPLIEVLFEGREILIPLVDSIVQRVDKKNKIIHVELPEGLLELN
jgi:16S rRNA processing protein RimM